MAMNKGFTLFVAMVVTGTLLLITAGVVTLSVRHASISTAWRESQYAFYAADTGLECAIYWDIKVDPSAFDSGARATFGQAYISEFSGIDTVSPLDQISVDDGTYNGPGTSNVNSGSKTTTYADELIFGYIETAGSGNINTYATAGPGFTTISLLNENAEEYKIVSTTGFYNASFVLHSNKSDDMNWVANMATFKGAAGQTIQFVQAKDQAGSLPLNKSIAFNGPSGSGNLIVAVFQYDSLDFEIESVTDNKGNTYVKAIGPNPIDNPYYLGFIQTEIWYAKNITGGGVAIEITPNGPAYTPQDIDCNSQHITAELGTSNDVTGTNPPQPHRIGGGGEANPTSIFQLNFPNNACAIVRVTKEPEEPTIIESRGYNTCSASDPRRVERAIRATY